MEDRVFSAALAGLLHDIGKFAQRAGLTAPEGDAPGISAHALLSQSFLLEYLPPSFHSYAPALKAHHQPDDALSSTIYLADHLACGNLTDQAPQQIDPQPLLESILARVDLGRDRPPPTYYALQSLEIDNESGYPTSQPPDDSQARQAYRLLWDEFTGELQQWKHIDAHAWKNPSSQAFLYTLTNLLRKYLSCMPASTSWHSDPDDEAQPDVSLYQHLRLTSALAACLAHDHLTDVALLETQQPLALIVRGELSGIQKFIYRITRPEADTKSVSKRLRGRSFYLSLLTEVVAEWMLRSLGLPSHCALFVGGGRFELIVPASAQQAVEGLRTQLEIWLLSQFQAELSLQLATAAVTPQDFGDLRPFYRHLDAELERAKSTRWSNFLADDAFLTPPENAWQACTVCHITALDDPQPCPLCRQHQRIGKYLPHASHLAWFWGEKKANFDKDKTIPFGKTFGVEVAILCDENDVQNALQCGADVTLLRLNRTADFIWPGAACGFHFLANNAPAATREIFLSETDLIEKDDILHFEGIVALSSGAKRLGVLKADVDYLGLVSSEGLNEREENGQRPTLARIASLSSAVDLFFAGHLERICRQVSQEWHATQNSLPEEDRNKLEDAVTELFYLVYSGGDDLFIIGPWDQILTLAQRLEQEMRQYCGHNPNLTLSAGVVQVKPRFPIHKFAEWVDEAEKMAKEGGRNRIACFNRHMPWLSNSRDEVGFDSLMQLAGHMLEEIEKGNISKSLVSDLGYLQRQHETIEGQSLNPMWTPRLHYTITRRVNSKIREDFLKTLIPVFRKYRVTVPVSIVSLRMRKE